MRTANVSPISPIESELNGVLMTPDEFDAFDEWDENFRYELVRDVLIVMPPADIAERKPNDELGHWLLTYHYTNSRGSHLIDTLYSHTIATRTSRRWIDRAIWATLKYLPDLECDVPTIAVEFVSASTRDRKRDYIDKRQDYAAAGVREYWIIDRFRRTMTVFCGMESERVVREGETYETNLLPGFELPLSRLLEIADRVTRRTTKREEK